MAEITDPDALAQLNATGDDFLKTLDPGKVSMVKALAEGRQALPAGYSMRSPLGQQLLADVAQYDPTFDAANLPSRIAARKAFTSGAQGKNITSFNTALGHLGTLAQNADALDNAGFTPWNAVANGVESTFGDPRVTNFNVAKQAVVDELERAFKGTGGNVHEIQQWENTLNSSRSPAQLRGAIAQAADLLHSRIGAMQDSYNAAMGTTDQPLPMLNQHAADALAQFQSPDYLSKGYGAIANASNAPPSIGGGNAPPPAGGTPPSDPGNSPAPNGGAPISALAGGAGNINNGAGDTVATGSTRVEVDPQASALVEGLVKRGATADQINAELAKQGLDKGTEPVTQEQVSALQGYLKANPNYSGFTRIQRTVDNPLSAQVAASPVGAALVGAGDAASFGTANKIGAGVTAIGDRLAGDNRDIGDIYDANLADANQKRDLLAQAHPLATLAGETGGFITGDALLGKVAQSALGGRAIARIPGAVRPVLGDALYGGLYGAGSSDNLSDVPGNIVKGAALSGAGGLLGRGTVKGVAALASPVANAAVRRLTDAGITLTPGQILGANGGVIGSTVKGLEDRAAGFPIIGDVINNARRGGMEDFNRAAINDALKPIGETASDIGHGGIADAQQKVSDAYTAALSKMSATPDAQFTTDLRQVGKDVQGLSSSHREQFNNIVDTDLQPYLNGKAQLGGDDLQAIKQGLDKRIARLSGSDGSNASPQDKDLADRLSDVRDAVMSLAGRTDPAAASDFQKADQAYAMLSRVNNAASKSKDGVFTPNQFRQAVTKRGYGTTTNNLARGSALMQQLSTDASTVLPNAVPDSGTSGRAALGLLAGKIAGAGAPGAALGGAAGYEQGGITGALTGAGLGALAFSRPGLRATQKVLAGSRGKTLNTLGDLLRDNSALGGAVGTPLLLQRLSK
jgi:hypothetical protein